MDPSAGEEIKQKISANKKLSIVVFGVVILAVVISLYFYFQYAKSQSLLNNPNKEAQAQADALVIQVGKLMELPAGEKPTVATVSDKSKLVDQPFFANAKNGDKVLIYSNVKKAILFRPSTNKIIEVAPVNLGSTDTSKPTTLSNPTTAPVASTSTPTPTKASSNSGGFKLGQ